MIALHLNHQAHYTVNRRERRQCMAVSRLSAHPNACWRSNRKNFSRLVSGVCCWPILWGERRAHGLLDVREENISDGQLNSKHSKKKLWSVLIPAASVLQTKYFRNCQLVCLLEDPLCTSSHYLLENHLIFDFWGITSCFDEYSATMLAIQ